MTDSELEMLRAEFDALKNNRTTVRLSSGAVALAWTILLTAAGALGFVIRLDSRVGVYEHEVAELRTQLGRHVEDEPDKMLVERTNNLDRRVTTLESKP